MRLIFSLCNNLISCCQAYSLMKHIERVRKATAQDNFRNEVEEAEWEMEEVMAEKERTLL